METAVETFSDTTALRDQTYIDLLEDSQNLLIKAAYKDLIQLVDHLFGGGWEARHNREIWHSASDGALFRSEVNR